MTYVNGGIKYMKGCVKNQMKYKKSDNKNKSKNITDGNGEDKTAVNAETYKEVYIESYAETSDGSDGQEAHNNVSDNNNDTSPDIIEQNEPVNDNSQSENDEPQEPVQTSALLDSIMSDNSVIAALGGAILLFIGSYLSFWGIKGDIGKISQGNLFTGYMAGGMFGKLCVLAAAVAAVLICIRIYKAAWYVQLLSALSYIVQVVLIIVNGRNVLGSGTDVSIYPGFGSIVCLAGIVIMIIFIKKLNGKKSA